MALMSPRGVVPAATVRTTSRAAKPAESYSAVTQAWLATAPLQHRKRLGQFITPRAVRERLLDQLPLWPGIRVLDPGVGTGEFLHSVLQRQPEAQIYGWDVDPIMVRAAEHLVPNAILEERSALVPYMGTPFDLVIGNPPYFQFRAAKEVRAYFAQVISGRPNVFALFFQAGLETLRAGGRLAYVVPPSMNNGAYFEALRSYITQRGCIEYLELLPDASLFENATTSVQLIVVRTDQPSARYVFNRTCSASGFRRTIFTPNPEQLSLQYEGRSSLWDLGYEAVTGTIVWNQHRDRLTPRPTDTSVPLLWAHNIRHEGLVLDEGHPKRPQHIRATQYLQGPSIVINRIVGAVGAGELRVAFVPEHFAFLAENHVNVIRPRRGVGQRVSWETLLSLLRHPAVGGRVRLLTGNTQLSATELSHLMPLDHE